MSEYSVQDRGARGQTVKRVERAQAGAVLMRRLPYQPVQHPLGPGPRLKTQTLT